MKKTVLALAAAGVVALGVAAPAQAHPGHRACDPGASVFAHTFQPFGQLVVREAAIGTGVDEEVALLHEAGCQDAPGQP